MSRGALMTACRPLLFSLTGHFRDVEQRLDARLHLDDNAKAEDLVDGALDPLREQQGGPGGENLSGQVSQRAWEVISECDEGAQ